MHSHSPSILSTNFKRGVWLAAVCLGAQALAFSEFGTAFEYGVPVQLDCGGENGNVQDAQGSLILKTGKGKWFNSYICTRGGDYGWKDAEAPVVYGARLRGIGGASSDWQVQLLLAVAAPDATDVASPAYAHPSVMGLVLKPSADGQSVCANFYVKRDSPRAGITQPFMRKGAELSAPSRDIPFGFSVDAANGKIVYFAGEATGETALTPEIARAFESGAKVYLALMGGRDAQPAAAEFSDFAIFKGVFGDLPKATSARRLAPAVLPAPASAPAAKRPPFAALVESFGGAQLPASFEGGGAVGGTQTTGDALTLAADKKAWSNSFVRTREPRVGWACADAPITYAVLPLAFPEACGKGACLQFFLVGGETAPTNELSPAYAHADVMGITIVPVPEGGYTVRFSAKTGRPRAGFNLDWLCVGATLRVAQLGVPMGFTLDAAKSTVRVFAGDQSTSAPIPPALAARFQKETPFVSVVSGDGGVPAHATVGGVRIFKGELSELPAAPAAKPRAFERPTAAETAQTGDFADLKIFFSGRSKPSNLGYSASASVADGMLGLSTGTRHWSREWIYTKSDAFTLKKTAAPTTFAFYPVKIEGDALAASLKFFLVGN